MSENVVERHKAMFKTHSLSVVCPIIPFLSNVHLHSCSSDQPHTLLGVSTIFACIASQSYQLAPQYTSHSSADLGIFASVATQRGKLLLTRYLAILTNILSLHPAFQPSILLFTPLSHPFNRRPSSSPPLPFLHPPPSSESPSPSASPPFDLLPHLPWYSARVRSRTLFLSRGPSIPDSPKAPHTIPYSKWPTSRLITVSYLRVLGLQLTRR